MMITLLGLAGMVVDFGHVFFSYRLLQSSTDAAALAAAEGMPNFTAAKTNASAYSSVSGNKNAFTNLQNPKMVTGYPAFKCLTTLQNAGMACVSDASGAVTGTANAIQIKQQATVPTTFLSLFGFKSVSIKASATASMRGAAVSPYNVAIILDTTNSMGSTDSNCSNKTRLACAIAGIQVLLQSLSPCAASQSTCSITNGVSANSVDRVSLFTFPNMVSAVPNPNNMGGTPPSTPSANFDCNSSTSPQTFSYTFPSSTATSMTTMPFSLTNSSGKTTTYAMTYQATFGLGDSNGFVSDYRTSDTSTTLNSTGGSASNLVLAVGGKSGCASMQNPGGEGTYYAGAIYAAQAALTAEATANKGSQNVIILVSDGDASSTGTASVTINGKSYTYNKMGSASTTTGTYPSTVNECSQAITAAQYAASQGTRVYSVAYGAPSSGCSTDTKGTYKGISPCQTMKNIASLPQYFYSDNKQSGSGVDTTCQGFLPVTALSDIFKYISGDLTVARLIPDNMT
jgi:Flp pilus assembly protein TadG